MATFHARLVPFARERITISSSALPLTASVYDDHSASVLADRRHALAARITVYTNSIYWTEEGTTPSASAGDTGAAGDIIYLETYEAIKKFKAIRVTGDAPIEVVYYRM